MRPSRLERYWAETSLKRFRFRPPLSFSPKLILTEEAFIGVRETSEESSEGLRPSSPQTLGMGNLDCGFMLLWFGSSRFCGSPLRCARIGARKGQLQGRVVMNANATFLQVQIFSGLRDGRSGPIQVMQEKLAQRLRIEARNKSACLIE